MFAQVLKTLRISVVLLTLTENLATPRLCATTSTTPLAAGTETAATPRHSYSSTHTVTECTQPQPSSEKKGPRPSDCTKKYPDVSLPIDIYRLELELANPDGNFVYNVLSMLKEGARIGYTGPRSNQVSPNLISAAQHPTIVSFNL